VVALAVQFWAQRRKSKPIAGFSDIPGCLPLNPMFGQGKTFVQIDDFVSPP
jgi:hypothetical protein